MKINDYKIIIRKDELEMENRLIKFIFSMSFLPFSEVIGLVFVYPGLFIFLSFGYPGCSLISAVSRLITL
jgi:hypothetical protein